MRQRQAVLTSRIRRAISTHRIVEITAQEIERNKVRTRTMRHEERLFKRRHPTHGQQDLREQVFNILLWLQDKFSKRKSHLRAIPVGKTVPLLPPSRKGVFSRDRVHSITRPVARFYSSAPELVDSKTEDEQHHDDQLDGALTSANLLRFRGWSIGVLGLRGMRCGRRGDLGFRGIFRRLRRGVRLYLLRRKPRLRIFRRELWGSVWRGRLECRLFHGRRRVRLLFASTFDLGQVQNTLGQLNSANQMEYRARDRGPIGKLDGWGVTNAAQNSGTLDGLGSPPNLRQLRAPGADEQGEAEGSGGRHHAKTTVEGEEGRRRGTTR